LKSDDEKANREAVFAVSHRLSPVVLFLITNLTREHGGICEVTHKSISQDGTLPLVPWRPPVGAKVM